MTGRFKLEYVWRSSIRETKQEYLTLQIIQPNYGKLS